MKPLFALLVLCLTISEGFAQSIYDVRLNEVLANGNLVRNPGGRGKDLVELYNNSDSPVSLAGAKLTDSTWGAFPYTPPKFIFPAEAIVPARGYFVVELDPDNTNNNFGLRASGDALNFLNAADELIDSVDFGFQIFNMSIGRSTADGITWTLNDPTFGAANINAAYTPVASLQPGSIRINEWISQGTDFVELYNTGSIPAELGNVHIADAEWAANPNPFFWPRIALLSFIGTGKTNGFVLFKSDFNNRKDDLPFGLNGSGDAIYLATELGVVLDQVVVSAQSDNDTSEGRLPDGGTNIFFFENRETPGRPNFGKITSIVINELLAHTDPPLEDAIELMNTNDFDVDIGGWYMGDEDSLTRFQFPPNTIVPARGFYVLYEYQFRFNSSPPDFTFNSSRGGTVFITQPDFDGILLAGLERPFGPSQNGVSFGRVITSDGDDDFVPLACRSFGKDNPRSNPEFRTGTGASNCEPRWGPLIISEVMFHPPDRDLADNTNEEYIEIRNISPQAVPLVDQYGSSWHVRGGVSFDFVKESVPPGGYMLLVKFNPVTDVALRQAFLAAYGLPETTMLRGPYTGRLGNGDDTIELFKPDPVEPGFIPYVLVDRVHYENEEGTLWPIGSNGTGLSLQRNNSSSYGDEPASWRDAQPTPARPNAAPISITAHPASQSVLYSNQAIFSVTVEGDDPRFVWLYKNKPLKTNAQISSVNSQTLVINNLTRKNAGLYSVLVTNFAGRVTSSNAVLTAIQPVGIKKHPVSRTVLAGKPAVFNVAAIGTKPLLYQWYHNGNVIPNATNKVYKIIATDAGSPGTYTAVVWNVLSEVTSQPAELTVTE